MTNHILIRVQNYKKKDKEPRLDPEEETMKVQQNLGRPSKEVGNEYDL